MHVLIPGPLFLAAVLAMVALGVVTTIWPAVEAIHRREWVWLLAIFVLSPFAGIAWLAVGRRRAV